MALVQVEKKGGPYTKKEQDERRNEVFKLHFEKRYSATKISEILNVNRNTINEDIRYWYSVLAQELNHDPVTWAIEQYHDFESQKNRLVEQLEKEESTQNKVAIEKLIFQINDKLSQFVSKIISSSTVITNPKNEEELMEKIKELVKYILLYEQIEPKLGWLENDILFCAIKKYKCDYPYANAIFENMEKLGLKLCEVFYETKPGCDLIKFAEMRGFLSDNEIRHAGRRIQNKLKAEIEPIEFEKKYVKKYGDMSKWADEIREKYLQDEEP